MVLIKLIMPAAHQSSSYWHPERLLHLPPFHRDIQFFSSKWPVAGFRWLALRPLH
jgi:hypothetical protein